MKFEIKLMKIKYKYIVTYQHATFIHCLAFDKEI